MLEARAALLLSGWVPAAGGVLLFLASCDYVKPDPLPPRGDEWVVEAIRKQASGAADSCADKRRFYRDADGDGFGDPKRWVEGCRPPAGYVQNDEDCYDRNPNAYPGQTESFAKDRGDGSFDYDCDGKQSRRMTNRAYCIAAEDGSKCRSASGWLGSKIPKCGQPGRWKWYECVTILYRPEPEVVPESTEGPGGSSGAAPSGSTGGGGPVAAPVLSPGSGSAGSVAKGAAAAAEYKKRFVCKGRELPWQKRQLCR